MDALSPDVVYFICCGLAGVVLHFVMMNFLSKDKKNSNNSISPIGVISDFWSLIKNEQNLKLKRKYQIIFWIQILIIPVYLIGEIIIMAHT